MAEPRTIVRLAPGQRDLPYDLFNLHPLGPLLGAEVSGLDLRVSPTSAVRSEIERALLEWKVIFFRDQYLTAGQYAAFAQLWGKIEENPFMSNDENGDTSRLSVNDSEIGRQKVWCTDATWRSNPPKCCMQRIIEPPSVGTGDTVWADTGAAYDNLPKDVKTFIQPLDAVHDFVPSFGLSLPADKLKEYRLRFPLLAHPVVRTHPITFRKTLFINAAYTTHIPALTLVESEMLMRFLLAQASIPELQIRWRWRAGDIAFWDNRATWRYAVSDYFPQTRIAELIAIEGDVPFADQGIQGRHIQGG